MDLSRPYGVISHPLDSAALVVLAGTTKPLTGHHVARLAPDGTQQGIAKALGRLVEQGLVLRTDAGSAHLYELNREHLASPLTEMLAGLRGALYERLRQEIESWDMAPVHASVFGSASRGDGGVDSDIDILIVRPREVQEDDASWQGQLDELADRVFRWTGNQAGLSELSEDDIERLARERPPVVDEIRSDAITLAGPEAWRLLKEPS